MRLEGIQTGDIVEVDRGGQALSCARHRAGARVAWRWRRWIAASATTAAAVAKSSGTGQSAVGRARAASRCAPRRGSSRSTSRRRRRAATGVGAQRRSVAALSGVSASCVDAAGVCGVVQAIVAPEQLLADDARSARRIRRPRRPRRSARAACVLDLLVLQRIAEHVDSSMPASPAGLEHGVALAEVDALEERQAHRRQSQGSACSSIAVSAAGRVEKGARGHRSSDEQVVRGPRLGPADRPEPVLGGTRSRSRRGRRRDARSSPQEVRPFCLKTAPAKHAAPACLWQELVDALGGKPRVRRHRAEVETRRGASC